MFRCLCHKQAHDEVHVRENHPTAAVAVQTQRVQRLTVCARTKKSNSNTKCGQKARLLLGTAGDGTDDSGMSRAYSMKSSHLSPITLPHVKQRTGMIIVSLFLAAQSDTHTRTKKDFQPAKPIKPPTKLMVVLLVVGVVCVVTWHRAQRGGA